MQIKKLTAKQKAFVECYCNPTSETFNNQRQSAAKAGYSKNTGITACQNILAKHSVKQAMVEYKADISSKQAITVEYIQSEHERLAALAESKGDLVTATRNKEDLGRTIGVYTENINTGDLERLKQLSEQQALEAKRLATIRLREA